MKKRYFAIIIAVLVLVFSVPVLKSGYTYVFDESELCEGYVSVDYENSLTVQSESAVLIDGRSKSVLFKKNENEVLGMASTTKIMTALVAIENCDIDREFLMPKEAIGIEGSSVYLKENEPLTMRELLFCLMLESGNDAATAIAICCAGSLDNFVSLMNERAEEIGLDNTHFTNPHGLSDGNHKTTAYDLAMITATAYDYPLFREIVSTKTKSVRFDGIENGRRLVNHNKLLFGYEGALGVKTGYTMADGKCLVSAAEKDGLLLVAVTLRDSSPTSTHRKLLDLGFDSFEQTEICRANGLKSEIVVENVEDGFLTVCNTKDISVCLPKGANFEIEFLLPTSLSAPIKKGEIIGHAVCKSGGVEVYIISLESQEDIDVEKKSLFKLFGEKIWQKE